MPRLYIPDVTITRRGRIVTSIALLAAVAAGCGETDGTPVSELENPSATDPAVPPTPVATTPEPLGTEIVFDGAGVSVRVAVVAFDPVVAAGAPAPASGGSWAAADVQTCVDAAESSVLVRWSEWSVIDQQDRQYSSATEKYDQFPAPQYPDFPDAIEVGGCVRGWVTFGVPDGETVDRVRFGPGGSVDGIWSTEGAVDDPDDPPPASEGVPPTDAPVVVGEQCSRTNAVGVDENTGRDIVCADLGEGGGTGWVNSAPIEGVNDVGDPCVPLSDNVSQTPDGLAILCADGTWSFGP